MDFIVLRESRVRLSVNESEVASDIIARSRHHVYDSRVFTAVSFFVARLSPYSYAAFRCAARPISVQRKIVANVAFESFHHRFLDACDDVLGSELYWIIRRLRILDTDLHVVTLFSYPGPLSPSLKTIGPNSLIVP